MAQQNEEIHMIKYEWVRATPDLQKAPLPSYNPPGPTFGQKSYTLSLTQIWIAINSSHLNQEEVYEVSSTNLEHDHRGTNDTKHSDTNHASPINCPRLTQPGSSAELGAAVLKQRSSTEKSQGHHLN